VAASWPYSYSQTPFWAGIFLLPLTFGFLVSGPTSGFLSDKFGSRGIATGGMALFGASFIGLLLLPVDLDRLFFSLMIGGLSSRLPETLTRGLEHQGVATTVAHHVRSLPPVSSLFASMLGVNPLKHLPAPSGALSKLPTSAQQTITGHAFFPSLISGPFHHGLVIVFSVSGALSVFAGVASLLRGGRYVDPGELPASDASGNVGDLANATS
jgi:MFS family permease